MRITSKPVCDIAGVGAIFPMTVSVGSEGLSAVCTGVRVDGFSGDLILMGIPPFHSTFIRAKAFLPFSRCLINLLTTGWTE
jgi:hypothetical protein